MQHPKKVIKSDSNMKSDFATTDAQKVKQEIQNDVRAGQGAMTSREAGACEIKNTFLTCIFIFFIS
ncbi:hypothetical protein [Bacillus cereus]